MRLPAVVTVDLRIIGKKAVRNEALAGPDAEWDETRATRRSRGSWRRRRRRSKRSRSPSWASTPSAAMTGERRYEAPPARKAGVKVASVDELVAKLHNEAKVI